MTQSWQGPPPQQQSSFRGVAPPPNQPPQRPPSAFQQHPQQQRLQPQQQQLSRPPQQQQQVPQQYLSSPQQIQQVPQRLVPLVNCKVFLPDEEVRRFRLAKTAISFNTILNKCLYDGLKRNEVKLYYKDEDNDWIRVTSEEEWSEAYTTYLQSAGVLKFLVKKSANVTSSPSASVQKEESLLFDQSNESPQTQHHDEEDNEMIEMLRTAQLDVIQKDTTQPATEQNVAPWNNTAQNYYSHSPQPPTIQQQQPQPQLQLPPSYGYQSPMMTGSFYQSPVPPQSPQQQQQQLIQQQQQQNQPQYEDEIRALANMGFSDRLKNLELLRKHNGELPKVVAELC